MAVRGLLVDRMSVGTIVCLALVYLVALLALGLGAGLAPERVLRETHPLEAPCADASSCVVTLPPVQLSGLSPANQLLLLWARLARPTLASTGAPASLPLAVSFPQTYTLSLVGGDGAVLSNATHTASASCEAGDPTCRLGLLAFLPAVTFSDATVRLSLASPQAPFAAALPGVALSPAVNVSLTHAVVDAGYTRFEVGWRYTGVLISLLVWLAYTVLLACGPGTRDEATGKRVASTFEQRYVWTLALLTIFLDRPGFLSEVSSPSLSAYAFGAVMQTTAIAALLLFFLFHFHLVALQSEAGDSGVQWDVAAYEGGGVTLGACFWVPKILIITLGWAVSLSLLLFSRWMQLTDPGYSVSEAYPEYMGVLTSFAYTIGGLYLVLLLLYMALGLRKCRSMPRSGRFFTTMTLLTLVLVVAGVFANSFTATVSRGGYFVVAFGVVNVYVWMLCVFFGPARRPRLAELAANAASLAAGKGHPADAAERSSGSGAGGAPPDTTGVLGATVEAFTNDGGDGADVEHGGEVDTSAVVAPPQPPARRRPGPALAPAPAAATAEAPEFTIEAEADEEGGGDDGRATAASGGAGAGAVAT